MTNSYVTLGELREHQGITGPFKASPDDAAWLARLEACSAEADELARRHFYSWHGSKTFDGPSYTDPLSGRVAFYPCVDIVSLSAVVVDADDDGTFELTLAANTDYRLWPINDTPKNRLDFLGRTGAVCTSLGKIDQIKLTGIFGYSNDTKSTGSTVQNTTEITSSGTALQVADGHDLSPGMTLVIESEHVYVTALSSTSKNTLTIERGVNGTTAAAHANGVAISRRTFPVNIRDAVLIRATQRFRGGQLAYSGESGSEDLGGIDTSNPWAVFRHLCGLYSSGRGII